MKEFNVKIGSNDYTFVTKISAINRLEDFSGLSIEKISDECTTYKRKDKLNYVACFLDDYKLKGKFLEDADNETEPLPVALLSAMLQSLAIESISLGITDEERLQYFPEKKLIDEVLTKLLKA